MSSVLEIVGDMNVRDSVRGSLSRLQALNLKAHIGKGTLPLLREIVVVAGKAGQKVTRYCEAFTVDQVGWRRPDVGFESGPEGEERHWES